MKLIVLVIFSIIVYAISLVALDKLALLPSGSPVLWLPFGLSFLAFLAGAVIWLGRPKASHIFLAVATVLCLTFIFASDVFVGVAYSCSKGDCL